MRTATRLLAALAVLVAIGGGAPASAAPPAGVLATDASDGPVAAYGSTVAWSRWDDGAGGYRLVVHRNGTTRALRVAPSPSPFGVSAGPGPDGATWLVWSRCDVDAERQTVTECDIEGYDLRAGKARAFPFAARPGVIERAPSIWRDRLAYATGGTGGATREVPVVRLVGLDGTGGRRVAALPASTCALSISESCDAITSGSVLSSALREDRLAVASRVSAGSDSIGICGLANVRLLDLRTSAGRTLDTAVCGLSGQGLGDLAFDADRRLWWRQTCGGDPSACEGGRAGPYRLTRAGIQRLVTAAGSRLTGLAVAGRVPVIAVRAPRTAPGCSPALGAPGPYRCATITAIGAPAYEALRERRRDVPPAGYLTVAAGRRLRVLRPPATMACSRGDLRARAGADLWAGAIRVAGNRVLPRPAIRVTATSAGGTVRGVVPAGRDVQATTILDLGGPRRACGRTWTLTYRPRAGGAIHFSTRVLAFESQRSRR